MRTRVNSVETSSAHFLFFIKFQFKCFNFVGRRCEAAAAQVERSFVRCVRVLFEQVGAVILKEESLLCSSQFSGKEE